MVTSIFVAGIKVVTLLFLFFLLLMIGGIWGVILWGVIAGGMLNEGK